jgi:hypothetical protein
LVSSDTHLGKISGYLFLAEIIKKRYLHESRIENLEETSGKKRDKSYVYRKYLNVLEHGTKPFAQ